MPGLASSRRVLAPSLLELGAPQGGAVDHSSDALADVVAGFLGATRTGKAALVGNSLGGRRRRARAAGSPGPVRVVVWTSRCQRDRVRAPR
ncbi:MAG: hypothetical protein M3N16_00215 [Actinomycetota bacterium]|nr:hypothetical protein [Actinomycetota bacterium]